MNIIIEVLLVLIGKINKIYRHSAGSIGVIINPHDGAGSLEDLKGIRLHKGDVHEGSRREPFDRVYQHSAGADIYGSGRIDLSRPEPCRPVPRDDTHIEAAIDAHKFSLAFNLGHGTKLLGLLSRPFAKSAPAGRS